MRYAVNVPNFGDYADPATFLAVARAADDAGWDAPSAAAEAVGLHAAYAEAGATWWSENVNGWRGSVREMLELVRGGPASG